MLTKPFNDVRSASTTRFPYTVHLAPNRLQQPSLSPPDGAVARYTPFTASRVAAWRHSLPSHRSERKTTRVKDSHVLHIPQPAEGALWSSSDVTPLSIGRAYPRQGLVLSSYCLMRLEDHKSIYNLYRKTIFEAILITRA